jgi:rubredoxin
METWHRVTFGHKDGVETIIESLNVRFKRSPLPGGGYLMHIDITESDPRWPQVNDLVQRRGALDMYDTIFTPEEIVDAAWVRLRPNFEQGFPQPEEEMKKWRQITYEDYCPECGAGYRQKAPFRLAKEPRLGKHDFLCLYWTYTVFCTSKVLQVLQTHQIHGYEAWPAVIHRTGEPSKNVSQLVFPAVAGPGLADVDRHQPETCPRCGVTKYAYHKRGYMRLRRESLRPAADIQLTHEWFGSGGHMAFREILISNVLARLILENEWRGVALKPIELV